MLSPHCSYDMLKGTKNEMDIVPLVCEDKIRMPDI